MNFYDVLLAKKLGGSGGGGGDTPTGTKQITENGTYNVSSYASAAVNVPASAVDSGTKNITENGNNQDVVGYAAVNVSVPNSYESGDEGKVVSSGALVSQTAHADVTPTTSDQTINTTTNNSIKVKGDANLVAGNIKKDVDIFGVIGSYEGSGGGGIDLDALCTGAGPVGAITITANNIRERLFKGCTEITSVIANSVTQLKEQIFMGCSSLQSISFTGATGVSSGQQFASCTSLTSVSIPNMTALGSSMFNGCSNLQIIDLKKVTSMNYARLFYNCSKLQTVILRYTNNVLQLNNEVFSGTPFAGAGGLTGTLYVPSALVDSYKTASNYSTLYNNGTMDIKAIEGSIYE